MFGRGLQLKTTALLVFFWWLVKSLKNLKIIDFLITVWNVANFVIASVILGLVDQQLVFWYLYLIELQGF